MVKGWKAGLLALTALATTSSAFAQRGEWGGRGGGNGGGGIERQGNPAGGGEGRRGWGGNPGGGPGGGPGGERGGGAGGGSGGWGQRGGGNGNGGGNAGAQVTPQPAPQPGPNRNWNDNRGDNRGWQGNAPRPEARPDPRPGNPVGTIGRSTGDWQRPDRGPDRIPGGDRNWADRNQPGRDWNRNDGDRDWNRDNRPQGRPQWDNRRPDAGRPGFVSPGNGWQGGGWQQGDRGRLSNADRWRDQRRWSNDWRRDSRYDWSRYRQYNRNAYRLPAYRPPMGWNYGYSRFSIGIFLGTPLFGNSYWIDDPYSYRLPPAYGTLRWIRYYDDALLVDIRDGYVVDVIHDFFW